MNVAGVRNDEYDAHLRCGSAASGYRSSLQFSRSFFGDKVGCHVLVPIWLGVAVLSGTPLGRGVGIRPHRLLSTCVVDEIDAGARKRVTILGDRVMGHE